MSDIIPTAPEPRSLPFRRPADYYAAPASEVRPIFPNWVPFGCGTASLIVTIALVVGGAMLSGGRASSIVAWWFNSVRDDLHGMYTKDVTPAEKAALDAELTTLQTNVTGHKVTIDKLQPLLRDITDASMDNKVTPQEAENLTKAAHAVNAAARR